MRSCRPSAGFTYLGLTVLVAIIGLAGAAGLKMGSLMQRRAAELALLDIGAQFSDALGSYAAATPPGESPQAPSLKDLLKDPRFSNPRRHLRQIFVDPITGKAEWGVSYLANGVGVLGIYSLSDARALKVGNFDLRFQSFEGKVRLSDWRFTMADALPTTPALKRSELPALAPPPQMPPPAAPAQPVFSGIERPVSAPPAEPVAPPGRPAERRE